MFNTRNIAFNNIAVHEGKGWFFNMGYAAIFQIDLETGKLKLEAFLPGKNLEIQKFCGGIVYYNDKLYLAPHNAKRLCIYDLRNQEFDFIDLDFERHDPKGIYNLFSRGAVIDDNIFFFPGRFPAIVKLNPIDNSVTYIDCWYDELSTMWGEDKRDLFMFFSVCVEKDGWLVMACRRANAILRINVLSEGFSIIQCDFDRKIIDVVETAGKYIGTFNDSNSLYEISDHGICKVSLETEMGSAGNIFRYSSNICNIAGNENKIYIYDLNTHEKKMSYEFSDAESDSQKWLKQFKVTNICNVKVDDRRVVVYLRYTGEILIVDMAECTVTSVNPLMDTETEKIIDKHLSELLEQALFFEKPYYDFKDFIDTLAEIQ